MMQAHHPKPEPRWHWWIGALAELVVIVACIVVILGIGGLVALR